MSNHVAVYGVVKIKRALCMKCKDYAFVIDSTFSCCDSPFNDNLYKFKSMTQTEIRRKTPSVSTQRNLLLRQDNKCRYCGIKFGEIYYKKDKPKISKIHYDHFIPYSYLRMNPYSNWVAACNECNSIKSNKMFNTMKDILDYIKYHRKRKGIEYVDEKLPTL